MTQKGVFNMCWSFATASIDLFLKKALFFLVKYGKSVIIFAIPTG
jgi:hypothetical protein